MIILLFFLIIHAHWLLKDCEYRKTLLVLFGCW